MPAKKKTWQQKLADDKGFPKVCEIDSNMSKRWGTGTFVIPGRQGVRGLISGGTGAESNPAFSEPGLLSETVGGATDLNPALSDMVVSGDFSSGGCQGRQPIACSRVSITNLCAKDLH